MFKIALPLVGVALVFFLIRAAGLETRLIDGILFCSLFPLYGLLFWAPWSKKALTQSDERNG